MNKTVYQCAGRSQKSYRTHAMEGSAAHLQATAPCANHAGIDRPLKVWQRLDAAPSKDPSSPRNTGQSNRPATPTSRCHEVEGSARGLNKASGLYAAVQEPAVHPTLSTPKILSAIKQNRSMDPPETFLGGGAPSSFSSLRSRRTLPPHTGKPAIVCLDAFGSPRGDRRG